MSSVLDPFGAPEFFVNGVASREMIGADILRVVYFATEDGERIVKVKLLWPVAALLGHHVETATFLHAGPSCPVRLVQ